MKKNSITMLFLCVFILLSSTYSFASKSTDVQIKLRGLVEMSLDWGQGWGAFNNTPTLYRPPFMPNQRVRLWGDFIASENLQATLGIETGGDWGKAADGLGLDSYESSDGAPIKIKQLYFDWTVPNTDLHFRMGLQRFAIPGLMRGNAIMGDEATGITASYKINENIDAIAFWFRPWDENSIKSNAPNDTADFLTLLFPMKYEGFQITPWAMFGTLNADAYQSTPRKNSAYYNPNDALGALFAPLYGFNGITETLSGTAEIFWIGMYAKINMFDPFSLEIEADFGSTKGFSAATSRQGWLISGLAEYKMGKIIPGLIAWYASGDDANIHNGSENLPMISSEWAATNLGFGRTFQTRGVTSNALGYGPSGTTAVGAQATLTLFEKLWQEVRIVYIRGTNDNANAKYAHRNWDGFPTIFRGGATNIYLTENDSALEYNLTSIYQIQKNLKFVVELGYLTLDIDTSAKPKGFRYEDTAHRISTSIIFSF